MLIVVDFPAPFGPRKPKISPAADLEVDAAHRFDLAVALDEAFNGTAGYGRGGGAHRLGAADLRTLLTIP